MRCSVLFRRTTTEPLDRSEDLRTAPGAFAIPMASEESYGDSRTQLSRVRGIHQRQGVVRAQHPKVNCGLETLTPNSMRDSRTSDLASLPRRMVELLTERGSLRAVVRSLSSEYKSRRIIPTVAKKTDAALRSFDVRTGHLLVPKNLLMRRSAFWAPRLSFTFSTGHTHTFQRTCVLRGYCVRTREWFHRFPTAPRSEDPETRVETSAHSVRVAFLG